MLNKVNTMRNRLSAIRPGRIAAVCAAAVLALSLSGCGYNEMLQKDEAASRAWGDLEAQLQRRSDLVPNLVETVRGFASHERETLQAVIEARAKATQVRITPEMLENEQELERFRAAQAELSSSIGRLLAVAEQYPQLQANQNFLDLQTQLEGTENRIGVARQRYNEAVQDFNFTIRRFPNSLTNGILLHLEPKEYFQADPEAREAPRVRF
jgi:LemA protein